MFKIRGWAFKFEAMAAYRCYGDWSTPEPWTHFLKWDGQHILKQKVNDTYVPFFPDEWVNKDIDKAYRKFIEETFEKEVLMSLPEDG